MAEPDREAGEQAPNEGSGHEATVRQDLPRGAPQEPAPATGARAEGHTLPTMEVYLGPEGGGQASVEGDGRFVDEGVVGYGGSAVVRQVFDNVLLRRVAKKAFTAASEGAQARFLAEAQITAQLEHPNIVPVHEFGTDDGGRAFLSMKLVTGSTLSEWLADLGERRLEPQHLGELLEVLMRVCDALAYAHSCGVTHRDLKPGNIMVGSFGQVYLMDWGIAALGCQEVAAEPVQTSVDLESTGVSGTPSYMAPEQVAGDELGCDERTDVFALGGVLYTILAGRPPHTGSSTREVLFRAMRGEIPPPDEVVEHAVMPARLVRIAMKALSQDPEDRYPTVEAMRAELIAFQRDAWQLPTRQFAAGEPIVCEGHAGEEAFVIVRGTCQVERESQGVVDTLGAGRVFGELAILTGNPRDATVRATTDVVVQVVSRQELEQGLGLDSWSGRFVKALAARVVELHQALMAKAGEAGEG